ncbi:MAG: AAA family ATPase [Catalinimonas sp.]
MTHPLNLILYGPPGTGKTYHTVDRTVGVVEGLSVEGLRQRYPPGERARLRQRFERYQAAGQVAFVTFHPSYAYEDFVEGLKPRRDDDGQLQYVVEDGIFKRLCLAATYALYVAHQQRGGDAPTACLRGDFNALYFDFITHLRQQWREHVSPPVFRTRSGGEVLLAGLSDQGNLSLRHARGSRAYVVSKGRLRQLYERFPHADAIEHVTNDIQAVIGSANATVYWAVFRALKAFEQPFVSYHAERQQQEAYVDDVLTAPDYETQRRTVADFDFGALTELDRRRADRYVLVIDEINRGSVAAIFGELITLIEPDKRAGNAEALHVQLPYSKEPFTVPPNLYLIGTMNTADRSTEALDAALRRRFHFVEMPPRADLLAPAALAAVAEPPVSYGADAFDVDLAALLATLNRRLERLLDRHHALGHAYFLGIATAPDPWAALRVTLRDRVLPLLLEYFAHDPARLELVVGRDFFEADTDAGVDFAPTRHAPPEAYEPPPTPLRSLDEMPEEAFRTAVRRMYRPA